MSAMNAQRQFGINTKEKSKSVEKLSSGYKINRAADDAAGLSISEKMRQQIRGLDRASTNAQDGISLVQVADGALAEVNDMLTRCVELSVQAANGTLSLSDRQAIQDEINQIRVEIDQISERTKFNEVRVLEPGDPGTPVFRDGDGVEYHGSLPSFISSTEVNGDKYMSSTYTTQETVTYDIVDNTVNPPVTNSYSTQISVDHAAAYLDFSGFNGSPAQMSELVGKGMYFTCCTCSNHYSIEFVNGPTHSMEESGDHYIFKVGIQGASTPDELMERILEATQEGGGAKGNPLGHYTKMVKNGDSLIVYDDRSNTQFSVDTLLDPAATNIDFPDWKNNIDDQGTGIPRPSSQRGLAGPGVARAKQVYDHTEYSDERAQLALQVGAGTGDFMILKLPAISSKLIGIEDINLLTQDKATDAITLFKDAGAYVSAERSRMGAYQNALEHTINNLDNTVENTTAAESRIRDVDMAEMMVKYSKENILEQAGQSMMAQANRSTEGVLSLLQ